MNTKQTTSILGRCPLETLLPWIAQIKEVAAVKILKEPKMGLIMMRSRDTVAQELFNTGEVLVSHCTATVDNHPGYGVVIGNQSELAEALAIIDGALRAQGDKVADLMGNMQRWLKEQGRLQQKQHQSEFNLLKRSKVNFETMEDPGVDINQW